MEHRGTHGAQDSTRRLIVVALVAALAGGCVTSRPPHTLRVDFSYPLESPEFKSGSVFVLPTPNAVLSSPADLTEVIAKSSQWFLALSKDPPNACFFLEPKDKDGPVMFGITHLVATERTVEGVLAQWPDAAYSVKLNIGPAGVVSGNAVWGGMSSSSTALTGAASLHGNVDDCFSRIRSARI